MPGDLEIIEAIKDNLMLEAEFSLEDGANDVAGGEDDMPEVQL
ncbi:hypothetical protein ACP70R_042417 [Stipagrostis hirtigluma subsp. patula]